MGVWSARAAPVAVKACSAVRSDHTPPLFANALLRGAAAAGATLVSRSGSSGGFGIALLRAHGRICGSFRGSDRWPNERRIPPLTPAAARHIEGTDRAPAMLWRL